MSPSTFSLGLFALVSLSIVLPAHSQTYTATYNPSSLPNQTENGQTGTNNCGTGSSQNSTCQNLYSQSTNPSDPSQLSADTPWAVVNSIEDFCLWAPPEPGPNSGIGNVEVCSLSNLFAERTPH